MSDTQLQKLTITSTDDQSVVTAQFNPKEVQVDCPVTWAKAPKKLGAADLEYTSGTPMSMSFELLFDGFEENRSVVPEVMALQKMTKPMKDKGDMARPPKVKVIWGENVESFNLPTFTSVIESVTVKYQMFSREGQVVRATANIKLKEAGNLSVGKPPR